MSKIAIQLRENILTLATHQNLVGEVCLDLKEDLPPETEITLQLIGTEHSDWLFEMPSNAFKVAKETVSKQRKVKVCVLKWDFVELTTGCVSGRYAFTFSIELPQWLPSTTFHLASGHLAEMRPDSSLGIQYTLQAQTAGLKCEHPVVLQRVGFPLALAANESNFSFQLTETKNAIHGKKGAMLKAGKGIRVGVSTDHVYYRPGQLLELWIFIDNSGSEVIDIEEVFFYRTLQVQND